MTRRTSRSRYAIEFGNLEDLRAKAEAELRAAGGAEYKPPSMVQGADRTGSIGVTVNLEGEVRDVEVLDDWRDHLDPTEFAAALSQAYWVAMHRALHARALARLAKEKMRPHKEAQWVRRFHVQPSRLLRSGCRGACTPSVKTSVSWIAAGDPHPRSSVPRNALLLALGNI